MMVEVKQVTVNVYTVGDRTFPNMEEAKIYESRVYHARLALSKLMHQGNNRIVQSNTELFEEWMISAGRPLIDLLTNISIITGKVSPKD